MTMEQMKQLHVDLAFGFSLYTAQNLDSPLLDDLKYGNLLVFQIDNPDYNAWELEQALRGRAKDDQPDRPITLIHVPVANPSQVDEDCWKRARTLATFVIQPVPAAEPAGRTVSYVGAL